MAHREFSSMFTEHTLTATRQQGELIELFGDLGGLQYH
jgi:hypothetical protein